MGWNEHEERLRRIGVFGGNISSGENMRVLLPRFASACKDFLGERSSVTVPSCDHNEHPLHQIWELFAGLTAEVKRVFRIEGISVLTVVRIARPRVAEAVLGPVVDNSGLLPDNRREASFRYF